MTIKLTCQVCQHPNIEDNICPNCETDLTLIRMLMTLPAAEDEAVCIQSPDQLNDRPVNRHLNKAFLFLLAGLVLGIIAGFALSTYLFFDAPIATRPTLTSQAPTPSPSPIAPSPALAVMSPEQSIEPSPAACTGFRYIVRPGDSLTLIAWSLYGDADQWVRIAEANPKVRDRGDVLEIGEEVLVPNQEAGCL